MSPNTHNRQRHRQLAVMILLAFAALAEPGLAWIGSVGGAIDCSSDRGDCCCAVVELDAPVAASCCDEPAETASARKSEAPQSCGCTARELPVTQRYAAVPLRESGTGTELVAQLLRKNAACSAVIPWGPPRTQSLGQQRGELCSPALDWLRRPAAPGLGGRLLATHGVARLLASLSRALR